MFIEFGEITLLGNFFPVSGSGQGVLLANYQFGRISS